MCCLGGEPSPSTRREASLRFQLLRSLRGVPEIARVLIPPHFSDELLCKYKPISSSYPTQKVTHDNQNLKTYYLNPNLSRT